MPVTFLFWNVLDSPLCKGKGKSVCGVCGVCISCAHFVCVCVCVYCVCVCITCVWVLHVCGYMSHMCCVCVVGELVELTVYLCFRDTPVLSSRPAPIDAILFKQFDTGKEVVEVDMVVLSPSTPSTR